MRRLTTPLQRRIFARLISSRHAIRNLIIIFVLWSLLDVFRVRSSLARAAREFPSQAVLRRPTRVFIASLHWNNEPILRDYWNDGVVDLARAFGPENVFVSVQESGSWDDSKEALRELDGRLSQLGVPRRILLDNTTHADEIIALPEGTGWVDTPRGRKELRRIPYLSRLRNLSLEPLLELESNGTTFDMILFLGDVVFTVADIFALLNTNNGEYAAACALDFSKPPLYYDTFALRDWEGHEHVMQTWPYFRAEESRRALKDSRPVPVSSCWNGVVFMPASAFTGANALRFRGVPDSLAERHLEGSECCLIHADNPASVEKGVYLNPNVRVGYGGPAYDTIHPKGPWLSSFRIVTGLWKNRFRRWLTTSSIKESVVLRRVKTWEQERAGRRERGTFCLINEMQILVDNGWAHV